MDLKAQQYNLADTIQVFRSRLPPEQYHQTVIALSLSRSSFTIFSCRFRSGLRDTSSRSQGKYNGRPHLGLYGTGRGAFPSRRSSRSQLLHTLTNRLPQHNASSLRSSTTRLLWPWGRAKRDEGVRDDRRLRDGFPGGGTSPLLRGFMCFASVPVGTRIATTRNSVV